MGETKFAVTYGIFDFIKKNKEEDIIMKSFIPILLIIKKIFKN
jgi:hypothetical protein